VSVGKREHALRWPQCPVLCRRQGGTHNVYITEGGNTGCAKLPFLFTYAVQSALKEVRVRHPNVCIVGQMDDHTLLGEFDDAFRAYQDMKAVFKSALGLAFNDSKAGVLLGASSFVPAADGISRRDRGPGSRWH